VTISVIIMLAAIAAISFACAPLAQNHCLDEGRKIQGIILKWAFNLYGMGQLALIGVIIYEAVTGERLPI